MRVVRDLLGIARAFGRLAFERARAKRCGAVAGIEHGFVTSLGPKIECERWEGHHGNHRAPYMEGAIEWPR